MIVSKDSTVTTLTIRIGATSKALAEAAAAANDETLSQVIRRALRDYTDKHLSARMGGIAEPSNEALDHISEGSIALMRSGRFKTLASVADDPGVAKILADKGIDG